MNMEMKLTLKVDNERDKTSVPNYKCIWLIFIPSDDSYVDIAGSKIRLLNE